MLKNVQKWYKINKKHGEDRPKKTDISNIQKMGKHWNILMNDVENIYVYQGTKIFLMHLAFWFYQ